jgi:hypothetical protein
MKIAHLLAVLAIGLLAGCSSEHLSTDIRTIAVNAAPRRAVTVFTPRDSDTFSEMANRQHGWLEGRLRGAINRQLAQSVRFQTAGNGGADGEIVFDNLRHGLTEVSADNYVVTINAEITIYSRSNSRSWLSDTIRQRTSGDRVAGHREITSHAGQIRSLGEFENPKIYQESLDSAVDKLALELVYGL